MPDSKHDACEVCGLSEVHYACERHLAEIEKLFAPHCKLTLVMRNPQSDDGDLILSRDDLVEVEAAVRKLRERGP